MDSLVADLRHALRNLARRPGFSALAILTLAIGLSVNAVAFTAVNALLFHPFAFPGVDRLGWVMLSTPGSPHGDLTRPAFDELRTHARAFDVVAAEGRQPVALTSADGVEQIWALFVSRGYFRALDVRPVAGRLLDGADIGSDDLSAVVSYRFWRTRLDGGSIAGRTLTIANRSVAIAGVLPEDFQGPGGLYAPDVWLPLERSDAFGLAPRLQTTDAWLTTIGRLAAGVTAAQAEAELTAIAVNSNVIREPGDPASVSLRFFPMREGHPDVQALARFVWLGMSAVAIVLVIACFNVAALLLARAAERQREMAIRAAIGASRFRIVRQLVTEGLVLAVCSGGVALGFAAWSGRLLSVFALPAPVPQRLDMHLDARVLSVTLVMVLIAGVLPAVLPALQATRRSLANSMRLDAVVGGETRSRVRSAFVATQIAGSTLFLALALLFVRSFIAANHVDLGFDANHMLVARFDPALYGFDGVRARRLAADLTSRLSASPDLVVTTTDRAPFAVGYPRTRTLSTSAIDCGAAPCKPTVSYAVGARYFEAAGIPLRSGRDFTDEERRTGAAVIVNETLARTLWPGRPAPGQTVRIGASGSPVMVVGVAGDVEQGGFSGRPASAVFYEPLRDDDLAAGFTLIARTSGDDSRAAERIREAVREAAPALPVASLTTMNELLELPMWPRRTAAGFFVACGALALALATVGLFGVVFFAVRQRTREFGIRIALGARGADVVGQVLREGVALALPGAALGLMAAAIAGRLLARALLGVHAIDPVSFAGAAFVEIAVAVLACAWPARDAARADPIVALRTE